MSLFKSTSAKNIGQLLLRYLAEVVIIFLGITISFLFEQWRENNREKQALIELVESLIEDAEIVKAKLDGDLKGTEGWLTNFDSLRHQRDRGKISDRQLRWLFDLVSGKEFGFFDPNSPAYVSAVSSGLIDKLPDSVQREMYYMYKVRLPEFQYLYNEQQQNISQIRKQFILPNSNYLYTPNVATIQPDLKKFLQEVQQPAFGNHLNQLLATEQLVRLWNRRSHESVSKLMKTLRNYRIVLQQ